jgi:NADPH:quinone reductase-like Zn-dependent oxidoreductase
VTTEDHDWRDRIRAAAEGKPIRAILDPVGGDLASNLIALLADGGSFIGYGDMSGQTISIPPLSLPERDLTIKGVSVGRWAGLPAAVRSADIKTSIDLASTAAGLFPIAAEYDLSHIADAIVHAEQSGRTGAVVLTSAHNNERNEES